MPTIYLRKDLYDEIVKQDRDVSEYVNVTIEAALNPTKEGKKHERPYA